MKMSYREFHSQLLGARLCDQQRWRAFNLEACLWSQFAFDDEGASYIPGERRHERGNEAMR